MSTSKSLDSPSPAEVQVQASTSPVTTTPRATFSGVTWKYDESSNCRTTSALTSLIAVIPQSELVDYNPPVSSVLACLSLLPSSVTTIAWIWYAISQSNKSATAKKAWYQCYCWRCGPSPKDHTTKVMPGLVVVEPECRLRKWRQPTTERLTSGCRHFIVDYPQYAEQYFTAGGNMGLPTSDNTSSTLLEAFPQYMEVVPHELLLMRPEEALVLDDRKGSQDDEHQQQYLERQIYHLLMTRLPGDDSTAGRVAARVREVLPLLGDKGALSTLAMAVRRYAMRCISISTSEASPGLASLLSLFPVAAPYSDLIARYGRISLVGLHTEMDFSRLFGCPVSHTPTTKERVVLVEALCRDPSQLATRISQINLARLQLYAMRLPLLHELAPEVTEMLDYCPYDVAVVARDGLLHLVLRDDESIPHNLAMKMDMREEEASYSTHPEPARVAEMLKAMVENDGEMSLLEEK